MRVATVAATRPLAQSRHSVIGAVQRGSSALQEIDQGLRRHLRPLADRLRRELEMAGDEMRRVGLHEAEGHLVERLEANRRIAELHVRDLHRETIDVRIRLDGEVAMLEA